MVLVARRQAAFPPPVVVDADRTVNALTKETLLVSSRMFAVNNRKKLIKRLEFGCTGDIIVMSMC